MKKIRPVFNLDQAQKDLLLCEGGFGSFDARGALSEIKRLREDNNRLKKALKNFEEFNSPILELVAKEPDDEYKIEDCKVVFEKLDRKQDEIRRLRRT